MRKLITLVIIATAVIGLNAQDMGTTVVLLNPATVKKKVDKVNEEIQDPKKNAKAATWFKRGELYQDVFNIGVEQVSEGMDAHMLSLFYKDPVSIETENLEDGTLQETYIYENTKYIFVNGALQNWVKINPIHENPLRVAIDSYEKARELDTKGSLDDKIKDNLNDYEGALSSFEDVLEINNMDLFAGEVDTTMIQYSGIIAREIAGKTGDNELYKKAIAYYQQLADVGFGGPNTYLQMKMDYEAMGDTIGALEILKKAYQKYPDTVNVIANVANTYIELKQIDEGIAFMEEVIAKNPNIPESYYWQGRMMINKEEVEYIDKAIASYMKAGELDPSIYYVWYDLGYIYYLQGADFYDRSNEEKDDATRERLMELGKEKYTAAIPVLEKAYKLNQENASVQYETLDLLQRIYYKEQMTDEYERVKDLKANL
jgi:tetratricopeptide (TPR) repeat protein